MFSKLNLRSKMLLSILSVVVIAFTLTIGLVSNKANSIVKKEAFDKTEQIAFRYSGELKEDIEEAMDAARILAHSYEAILMGKKQPERELLDNSLRRILEKSPKFSGIWVMVDPKTIFTKHYSPWFHREGSSIVAAPTIESVAYEASLSNEFYTLPKRLGKEVLIEPYEDPDLHSLMTTATVPIVYKGRCIGVVGIDIVLEGLTEMVTKIRPYGTGVASLISNAGKYVAHPDKERVGKDIGATKLLRKAKQAIENGEIFTMISYSETLKTDVYRVFVPSYIGNSDTPWSFSVEIPMERVLQESREMTYSCIITGIISVLLAAIVIFLVSGTIVKPIKIAVAGLKDIAEGEGDLTMRLEVKSRDEIGELAIWFNTFIEKLQGIITEISENANVVAGSSTDLSAIAVQISSGAENTAVRANTVATATEEMTTNLNNVAAAMEQSTTNTGMVAAAAEEMTSTINEIAKNTEMATHVTDKAVQKAKSASSKMSELEEAAITISKVTEVINEISEQTNLLALNATIEAARAGEAGKGFAVVANEIKELANQTAKATLDIKNQIEGVQKTTTTAVKEIDETSAVIDGVNDIVTIIAAAVEEQSTAITEIVANISQVSQGISEVNENINQSSAVAGEISQEITQVNSETSEISSGIGQVNLSATKLNEMSAKLSAIVGMFKV
ncbi:methyl-accepting chemotaxis protein [Desulfotalea psychrophila]|uniref:Related to methyl-accepting chemotaxis protein n=1 Tax=Desulfotalea psychrophila (strain LSv54 / DSM 12343) TaxID=177439 RepID=Q6APL0_DESPS|nr:methyl-accepting chemotaxis protein [Desulfotalea psychrophila]CAG35714.1 related to methyl-accepting chemotaxis protein [Desulfotalea psychrophila LSv54]